MGGYENTETLTIKEAATLMHKNPCFVRQGLIDKRFSFGSAVFQNGRWNFYINRQKFFDETGIRPTATDGGTHNEQTHTV